MTVSENYLAIVLGELPSNSPRRIVQYIYRNSVVSFREQKPFVLKTVFFSDLA